MTFLFTDIESSTQLWEKHPQAMSRSLAQHDRLLRTVFASHNGQVFKTVGDAFCVVFENSQDAVLAAAELQRALVSAAWEGTGPLRVRVALHSGDAERRENDYFGQTLNRVARLLAAGHGGQTLVSHVTAELLHEVLPAGLYLRDMGERKLKDLGRPERIFQLVAPDLPSDFPPLRSLEVLPNNLPAQVTSFVGRSKDISVVKGLLNKTRLLTLTGPGGTGKTRLGIQVAAELLDRFPQGVWLVELATISDPTQVPEAIAGAMDIREEHGRAALETLVHALRTRRLLLVMDNCEHLLDACARIASTLLRSCPELRILATSREALSIEGETIQHVSPLKVVEFERPEYARSVDKVAQIEAVQLFLERASAARPEFELTAANALVVAKICWRLDGIPLAIELAAARVKVLTLEQILEQLDDRFRLLSAGNRAAQSRQQTLGALIDWSYDLLSEPERILLRRLSVFVAGRTVAMAEEVCAGDGIEKRAIQNLLSALVEKSLLIVEPGPNGESRYTMLESVWDYCDEKLAQHQETSRYRRKHLDFFVWFAERIEPELFGPDQKAWFDILSIEQFNLTMALRFSREQRETTTQGLRLAGAISRYWEVRSYLTEGYEHFQSLLAAGVEDVPPAVLAKAELGAGRLSWCQSRTSDALRHYRMAQESYRRSGNMDIVGLVEAFLGFVERDGGDPGTARAHFYRAAILAEEQDCIRMLAAALNGLSSLAADERDFGVARDAKERILAVLRSQGDQWIVALTIGSLGRVCFMAEDYAAAQAYLREFLRLVCELGNKWTIPYAIELIADVCLRQAEAQRAVQLYGAASEQREALALDFTPTELTAHLAAMTRLRAALPAEEFDLEWHRGRSLGIQAAIELAL